jgi:hypothetical protein
VYNIFSYVTVEQDWEPFASPSTENTSVLFLATEHVRAYLLLSPRHFLFNHTFLSHFLSPDHHGKQWRKAQRRRRARMRQREATGVERAAGRLPSTSSRGREAPTKYAPGGEAASVEHASKEETGAERAGAGGCRRRAREVTFVG